MCGGREGVGRVGGACEGELVACVLLIGGGLPMWCMGLGGGPPR